jgi:hypothetical protein
MVALFIQKLAEYQISAAMGTIMVVAIAANLYRKFRK